MIRRIRSLLLPALLLLFAWTIPVQATPVVVDPVTITLPDSWQVQDDLFGIFFGSDAEALTYTLSFLGEIYQNLTGSTYPAGDEVAPEAFVGGLLLVLDAETAASNPLIAGAPDNPDIERMIVDERPAIYNSDADNGNQVIQFAGIITDDEVVVILILSGTRDLITEAEILTLFGSITFGAAEAETIATTEAPTAPLTALTPPPPFAGLTLLDTVALRDYLAPTSTALAPNGAQLARMTREGICILSLGENATPGTDQCFENRSLSFATSTRLRWSPDSRYLATHEDLRRGDDTDIYVLDTTTGRWSNRTDDFYEGSALVTSTKLTERGLTSLPLDVTPVWSPDGQTLYFFRSDFSPDVAVNSLYRLNVGGSDAPELVTTYSTEREDLLTIVEYPDFTRLNGAAVVSPDGTRLAALDASPRSAEDSTLLLFDLTTGELTELAKIEDFQAGLPAFVADRDLLALFSGLAWLPDGSGLVVSVSAPASALPVGNLYQYNLQSGEILPLLDLSDITTQEALTIEQNGIIPLALVPYEALVLPDGSGLVWGGMVRQTLTLWSVALPFTGAPYTLDQLPPQVMNQDSLPLRNLGSIGQQGDQVRFLSGASLFLLRRDE